MIAFPRMHHTIALLRAPMAARTHPLPVLGCSRQAWPAGECTSLLRSSGSILSLRTWDSVCRSRSLRVRGLLGNKRTQLYHSFLLDDARQFKQRAPSSSHSAMPLNGIATAEHMGKDVTSLSEVGNEREVLQVAVPVEKTTKKKRVALWLGYIGSDYRGLQVQREANAKPTIEEVLEMAVFKAGGMLESNFGDFTKLKWNRSSRTDKGVHSLATVVSFKMEVPLGAWDKDASGLGLASAINAHLPPSVRVFGVMPANKSFNARMACKNRTYHYLVPAPVLGIKEGAADDDVASRLTYFRDILRMFEGKHPYHNYTVRSLYRPTQPKTSAPEPTDTEGLKPGAAPSLRGSPSSSKEEEQEQQTVDHYKGSDSHPDSDHSAPEAWHARRSSPSETRDENAPQEAGSYGREHGDPLERSESPRGVWESLGEDGGDAEEGDAGVSEPGSVSGREEGAGGEGVGKEGRRMAWWMHEKDSKDYVGSSHFRVIRECTCDDVEVVGRAPCVRVSITGDSFMLHQIRKMVATAIVVYRGLLPVEAMRASLSRHARVVLPLAPPEGLVLARSEFHPFRTGRPQPPKAARSINPSPSPLPQDMERGVDGPREPSLESESEGVQERAKSDVRPREKGKSPEAEDMRVQLRMCPQMERDVAEFWSEWLAPAVGPFLDAEEEPWGPWVEGLYFRGDEWVPPAEVERIVAAHAEYMREKEERRRGEVETSMEAVVESIIA